MALLGVLQSSSGSAHVETLTLITAILQFVTLVATAITIYLVWRTIREARKTTSELKETQAAINYQTEALYVTQLRMKWNSPEIRTSKVFADLLVLCKIKEDDQFSFWTLDVDDFISTADRKGRDEKLEIPFFFNEIVMPLVEIGNIREATAINHFGADAVYYWGVFKDLIKAIQSTVEGPLYHFDRFERFAEKASLSLAGNGTTETPVRREPVEK